MERPDITEADVKYFLRNKDKLIMDIHEKIHQINRSVKQVNDIMESVSYHSTEVSDMPHARNGHKDMSDVYEKYLHKRDERLLEYKQMLWALMMKEETIERVWSCFLALSEPYYSIIKHLYVENELYATAEAESGLSRQVFEKYRKRAMELIIGFYHSDKTDAELLSL